MAGDGESLESCLNKATSPCNRQEEWEHILAFCERVNEDPEGPQVSVRLLVHKIQSPQEWEALQALTVLEACVKNCGRRFHSEVGKFKFLNELVKVISPKYLGDTLSEKVKTRVVALLYGWTVSLPDEAKISEAYQMLKSQDVLSADPEIPLDDDSSASSPRQKNPVFDDEKKNRKLSELLRSKRPQDLQEANRLIKNMVKEDEVRAQRATKLKSTLEAVDVSVQLLDELLAHYSPDGSTEGDKELIKELYSECDKLRQTVCQFASESEDHDSSLGHMLRASDDLTQAINSYKKREPELSVTAETESAHQTPPSVAQGTSGCTEQPGVLIDLLGLDVQSSSPPLTTSPSGSAALLWGAAGPLAPVPNLSPSLLDQDLFSLGLGQSAPEENASTCDVLQNQLELGHGLADFDLRPPVVSAASVSFPGTSSTAPYSLPPAFSPTASSALNCLGPAFSSRPAVPESGPPAQVTFPPPPSSALPSEPPPARAQPSSLTPVTPPLVLGVARPPVSSAPPADELQNLHLLEAKSPSHLPGRRGHLLSLSSTNGSGSSQAASLLLDEAQRESGASSTKGLVGGICVPHSLLPVLPARTVQDGSLADVFVPLDTIKPSQACPVTVYDKHGLRVLLHLAADGPAGQPDVLVMVAWTLSTAPLLVTDLLLQAAVPKMMKVRLQQPSGTVLAPFNPTLPPASITQVVLLANPLREKVRMRFKLSFTLGEKSYTEVTEVTDFPPVHTLGALEST